MSKLTSVFFGTPEFSLPSLEAAAKETHLLAVVSQPDRSRGRGQKLSPSPVKAWAIERNIPVFTPVSLRKASPELTDFVNFISKNRPHLMLVTAYGNLLPQAFLDLPTLGPINVHASLLPKWRGAAPIQRSLEAGDAFTGVSLQRMVMELDAGDVLAEAKVELTPDSDASSLTGELASLGGELLAKFIRSLKADSKLEGHKQDALAVSVASKISKAEGLFSPNWSASDLHNKVRAFCVWPKVEAMTAGSNPIRFKILKTKLSSDFPADKNSTPAALRAEGGRVWLRCKSGVPSPLPSFQWIELFTVQPENRSSVGAASFFGNLFAALPPKAEKALQLIAPSR